MTPKLQIRHFFVVANNRVMSTHKIKRNMPLLKALNKQRPVSRIQKEIDGHTLTTHFYAVICFELCILETALC